MWCQRLIKGTRRLKGSSHGTQMNEEGEPRSTGHVRVSRILRGFKDGRAFSRGNSRSKELQRGGGLEEGAGPVGRRRVELVLEEQ